jgi:bacterioferritin
VPEVLNGDLQLEVGSQKTPEEAIACCEKARDYVSRWILAGVLGDAGQHIDLLETQIAPIGEVGLPNHLQPQMGEPA